MVKLIVALPEGPTGWRDGSPRGLFYADTPEGNKRAEEFARTQDRPGWGVFQCAGSFPDDADEGTLAAVLAANGWGK
jgi:hypothetical protein